MTGTNFNSSDYDGRTALHVASAEGHLDMIKFLLEKCKVNPDLMVGSQWSLFMIIFGAASFK